MSSVKFTISLIGVLLFLALVGNKCSADQFGVGLFTRHLDSYGYENGSKLTVRGCGKMGPCEAVRTRIKESYNEDNQLAYYRTGNILVGGMTNSVGNQSVLLAYQDQVGMGFGYVAGMMTGYDKRHTPGLEVIKGNVPLLALTYQLTNRYGGLGAMLTPSKLLVLTLEVEI